MHAAVCLWLRGGSGGHQLRRARLSLRSSAGALLCLQRPARHHTLPAPDQQVRSQSVFVLEDVSLVFLFHRLVFSFLETF